MLAAVVCAEDKRKSPEVIRFRDVGNTLPATASYRWRIYFVGRPYVRADGRNEKAPILAGIAVDGRQNVYVAEGEKQTIARITPKGETTTIAGSPGSPGSEDGKGSSARFSNPQGLALDGSGDLYVSDRGNHTIRKITSAGVVTTFAGSAGQAGYVDGLGRDARFSAPGGIALDSNGTLFVSANAVIRKITDDGVVSTLPGWTSGDKSLRLYGTIGGLAVDSEGSVYAAGYMHQQILKVTPDGVTAPVAGVNERISVVVDGPRSIARFMRPTGVATDVQGNVYMADGMCIRRMTSEGTVTTIGVKSDFSGHDKGAAARFDKPRGVAVSTTDVIYVTCQDCIIQGVPIGKPGDSPERP